MSPFIFTHTHKTNTKIMKQITLSHEFESQIRATESKLALKCKNEIFLINSIKTGRHRTYLEMQNGKKRTTKNLKTIIKRGMELIDDKGRMYTPKSWDGSMFILTDGKILKTGYTSELKAELDGQII